MLRSPEVQRHKPGARARVLLFTQSRDWHARRLAAALGRRNIEVSALPLGHAVFDSTVPAGLRLGNMKGLPDGVLVRNVAAGSFEAVTRRLGILHALKTLGISIWNEPAAIERCVDKSMTTFLLGRAGLAVPEAWTVEGLAAARRIARRECAAAPLVLKPLFGSQGRGLSMVRAAADLPEEEAVAGVFYLQRFVGGAGPDYRDFRIFVIDGEPVAAMARHGATWITNVSRGGRPMPTPLDHELSSLAAAAADAVGAAFCGVDILRSPDGTAYVLEVNSMPAWSGLQSVVRVDIADLLAERFVRFVRKSGVAEAA
jgi:RimK family alpha-L-glutamate ligase